MTLQDLPALLREDEALARLAGTRSSVLAVPEPARALRRASAL